MLNHGHGTPARAGWDRRGLELAMAEAEQAARAGTFPIGAVIAGPDGAIISAGRNRVYTNGDATAHAEVEAIRRAGRRLLEESLRHRCTLYTTTEPCLMCTGALLFAHLGRVVWAMSDDIGGAVRRLMGSGYMQWKWDRLAVIAAPYPDQDSPAAGADGGLRPQPGHGRETLAARRPGAGGAQKLKQGCQGAEIE